MYQELITRGVQPRHVPVKAFSQTDRFSLNLPRIHTPRRNFIDQLQAQT